MIKDELHRKFSLSAIRAGKDVSVLGRSGIKDSRLHDDGQPFFFRAELANIVIQAHERIRGGIMFVLNSFKCRETVTLDEFVMRAYIDQLLEFLGFLDEFFHLAMHGKNGLLSVDEFIGELNSLLLRFDLIPLKILITLEMVSIAVMVMEVPPMQVYDGQHKHSISGTSFLFKVGA
ncbi:hypothetical protein NB636_01960 [Oxalobacter aliiformigenes]|uniref:hypothetical protein n=1 Tax=Oxalobacter aliiformigenes TaxID=2946593 RepID=UPI0022AFB018|nr:hypothetical protein [Oxalobacter aliiformigenes]MCZ4065472.1 hypothetical protein [Oxalobacter aliiformigenes]WAV99652.1 hypothetical protein NB636_01960 [Oxalobacter aliiformigenes]